MNYMMSSDIRIRAGEAGNSCFPGFFVWKEDIREQTSGYILSNFLIITDKKGEDYNAEICI